MKNEIAPLRDVFNSALEQLTFLIEVLSEPNAKDDIDFKDVLSSLTVLAVNIGEALRDAEDMKYLLNGGFETQWKKTTKKR